MKNIALALLMGSSVLAGSSAIAQTNDTTTAPSASGTSDMGSMQMPASGEEFMTARQPNQFLASNIRGANVMGPQQEKIGTVSDMIVGQDGRLAAITVDVGGFLGIGAKTVAIPADGIQYVPVSATAAANVASNNAMAPAGTAAPATGATAPATDPAVTGSTTSDTAGGGAMQTQNDTAAATGDGARLDHLMVNFTRDQLQNAPEFND